MGKSPGAFRTISEVAEWLETPAHVLRFWETKFTQIKPVKRAGGRRYYRPADMQLVGGIKKLLHEDGMTIKGVQKLMRDKGVKHVSALSQIVEEAEPAKTSVKKRSKPVDEKMTPPVDTMPANNVTHLPAKTEPPAPATPAPSMPAAATPDASPDPAETHNAAPPAQKPEAVDLPDIATLTDLFTARKEDTSRAKSQTATETLTPESPTIAASTSSISDKPTAEPVAKPAVDSTSENKVAPEKTPGPDQSSTATDVGETPEVRDELTPEDTFSALVTKLHRLTTLTDDLEQAKLNALYLRLKTLRKRMDLTAAKKSGR